MRGNTPIGQLYTHGYHENLQNRARNSAREIAPLLMELLRPASVVDVGCGLGSWLRVFQENGVNDILGIDGDYVRLEDLEIAREQFCQFDLGCPLRLERRFDLVVSLEVAEHLPPDSAEVFVESLSRLGPVVLFSAAIPEQGGRQHVNEQWPAYWSALFQAQGFVCIDCLRSRIWNNPKVAYWYKQNTLLFVGGDFLRSSRGQALRDKLKVTIEDFEPVSANYTEATASAPLSLVHPIKYSEVVERLKEQTRVAQLYIAERKRLSAAADPSNIGVKALLRAFPHALRKTTRTRLLRIKSALMRRVNECAAAAQCGNGHD
jgi:SAM-dependent methyltransferase